MGSELQLFSLSPTSTSIYVTATPQIRLVVVTNTPTEAATSVLAPTLDDSTLRAAVTFAPTATDLITLTPTFTPTPTDTPVTPGVPLYVPVGGLLSISTLSPTCVTLPSGGFGTIFSGNPSLAAQVGCPTSSAAVNVTTAYQTFERGFMVYVSSIGSTGQRGIYVFYNNNTYQRFLDTWTEGVDPELTGLTPPREGLSEPIRGFGKIWRSSQDVQNGLGWATGSEVGDFGGYSLLFERGEMIYLPQTRQTYVLAAGTPGAWSALPIPY
jgi:hypothetical protein